MKKKPNDQAVFELKGRALRAAKLLEQELKQELSAVPVKNSGNIKDISDSWDTMYEGLIKRLDQDAPGILNETGLTSPSIMVYKGVQSLPRAYKEHPAIFTSPEQNPRYFMYSPVDYKGDYFKPLDSKLLSKKEEQRVGDLLFAGGWLGNAPIVSIKKIGVATPEDYSPPTTSELRKSFSHMPNDRVVFLARGKTLDLVNDYNDRTKKWEKAIKATTKAIKAETKKNKNKILAVLPKGEDIRISSSYSYAANGGGMASITLSARREGKVGMLNAGKTVPIPESPAYLLEESGYGEYKVRPRTDTPEGKKLSKLFNKIPNTPSLSDYPELLANYKLKKDKIGQMLGINGSIPRLHEIDNYKFLIYNASPDDLSNSFSPPEAKAVPIEAYEWLNTDKSDKNMGVRPPPAPKTVKQALSSLSKHKPNKNRKP